MKDCLNKLVNILDEEIRSLEQLKLSHETLEYKISLLDNIINQLRNSSFNEIESNIDSILLQFELFKGEFDVTSKIYGALYRYDVSIKKFDESLKNSSYDEMEDIIKILREHKNKLTDELNKIKNNSNLSDIENISEYRIVLYRLNYNQFILPSSHQFIRHVLEKNNVSDKDFILFFEYILMHNQELYEKKNAFYLYNVDNKYSIIDMLDMKYTDFTRFKIDNSLLIKEKTRAVAIYNAWKLYYKGNGHVDYKEILPMKYTDFGSQKEFEAFYIQFLTQLQTDMKTLTDVIQDKDFYFDKEIRQEIIVSFTSYLNFYKQLLVYLSKQYKKDINEQGAGNFINKNKNGNHILFAKRTNGESFAVSDIEKNVPETYLEKVADLLNGLKDDTLPPSKKVKLTNHPDFSAFMELKNDQVRIICKRIKDNIYEVCGVFVKKNDTDIPSLERMTKRPTIPIEDLKLYLSTEEADFAKIINYCMGNKVRGNR